MAFHQFNTPAYNTAQYNADATFLRAVLTETLNSADTPANETFRSLADSLTYSDTSVRYAKAGSKFEFVFLTDATIKSVISKGFLETLRTNDWLEIERKNSQVGS